MLDVLIENRECVITIIINNKKDFKDVLLTLEEWGYLEDIRDALKSFYLITKTISSQKNLIITNIIPISYIIEHKLLKINNNDSLVVK